MHAEAITLANQMAMMISGKVALCAVVVKGRKDCQADQEKVK